MAMTGVGRAWRAALVLLAAAVSLSGTAEAGDPVGRFSAALRMGLNGYDMGPINRAISRSNSRLSGISESSDWELPGRIHQGFNVGGDINYEVGAGIRLGLVYGTTWGSSSVDFLQKITIEPRSRFLFPRASIRLPYRAGDNMSLRAFAGPMFLLSSQAKISHENTGDAGHRLDSMMIKGSGTGVAGGLAGEYTLSDRFSLNFEAGYQLAKAAFSSAEWSVTGLEDPLGDTDLDGIPNDRDPVGGSYLWGFFNERYADPEANPPQDTEHEPTPRRDLDIDFSGFILQAGFRVYLF